jgi:hypothetical protein
MRSRKTAWGQPGQTGVTKDGVPWYVPEKRPGLLERMLYWLFPVGEGGSYPPGARLVPARTAQEVRERVRRKYAGRIAALLQPGEVIDGFIGFRLTKAVPSPPRTRMAAKVPPSPLKRWWMGGGWDTMAGQLVMAIGGSADTTRRAVWVRTAVRIVIMLGEIDRPLGIIAAYDLPQVGIRPGWTPPDPARGEGDRVDVAFADGSWLGLYGSDLNVPGSTKGFPIAELIAELAGPPATAAVLPPVGRR